MFVVMVSGSPVGSQAAKTHRPRSCLSLMNEICLINKASIFKDLVSGDSVSAVNISAVHDEKNLLFWRGKRNRQVS